MMFKRERFFTFATLVRSLGAVQQQMRMKTVFVRETLAAVNANVRSFSGMYSRMRREMMLQKERFAAFGTGVRSFLRRAGLASHVLLLLDFGLDLRGVYMGENVSEMSGAIRLTGRHVVGGAGLIRSGSCSFH